MDDLGKRVTVAIRIRPKILSAHNATQVAERYHPDACTKIGDSTLRLADTSLLNGGTGNAGLDNLNAVLGKEGRMNTFNFDYVFDQDSSQLEVYEETTLDAVDAALSGGCNATIMTYGQTGSGKTYTVLGAVGNNPLSSEVVTPDTGLFLRVLKDILSYAEARRELVHVVVGLTVTEVYLDAVRDLLAPLTGGEPPNLKVVISDENTRLPDVTYRTVTDVRDAVDAYRTATNRRVCRATEANDQSSRSHAIFSIDIYQQRRVPEINPDPLSLEELVALRDAVRPRSAAAGVKKTPAVSSPSSVAPPARKDVPSPSASTPPATPSDATPPADVPKNTAPFDVSLASNPIIRVGGGIPPVVLSRIVLTDLAGSEKLKHSKAKGEALEEMKKINGSLTALGNVVHSLFYGSKHVPYRDSKLTIMLRTTFATPNNRIVLIANCAPTALTYDETLSTMFFADKVKAMKVEEAAGNAAAKAALAMQLEADVLKLSKEAEELSADMRILQAAYGHRPCVRVGLLSLIQRGADVGLYRPRFGARTGGFTASTKSTKALLKPIEDKASAAVAESKTREAEEFVKVLDTEAQTLKDNIVTVHLESMARARAFIESNAIQSKVTLSELDATLADLENESKTTESALLTLSDGSSVAQKRVKELVPLKDSLTREEGVITLQLNEIERAYMAKYKDHQDEWDRHTAHFTEQESDHSRQHTFFQKYLSYLEERAGYFKAATETELEHLEVSSAAQDLEVFDVSQWIRRALSVMANNAVIRSNNALRAPRVPKTRPAALDGRSPAKNAPKARPDKPQQGRLRANTPFDQPALLGQIRTYMETGCTLLMYGKRGSPHFRFFFLSGSNGADGSISDPRLHWCKEESDRDTPDAQSNSIDLTTVFRITIGKSLDVFPSLSRDTASADRPSTDDDDYYTSFAIHYLRDGREPKVVCITTESKAEMEAWVIGICDVCRVNPEFGEPLPVISKSDLAEVNKANTNGVAVPPSISGLAEGRPAPVKEVLNEDGVPLSRALVEKGPYQALAMYCSTDLEVRLCESWHIPPKAWLSFKVRVQMMTGKGQPLVVMTPGELRHLFALLDIFRANAAWEMLAQLKLLERSPDSISYLTFSPE